MFVNQWLERNGINKAMLNNIARKRGLIGPKDRLGLMALFEMAVKCEQAGITVDKILKDNDICEEGG